MNDMRIILALLIHSSIYCAEAGTEHVDIQLIEVRQQETTENVSAAALEQVKKAISIGMNHIEKRINRSTISFIMEKIDGRLVTQYSPEYGYHAYSLTAAKDWKIVYKQTFAQAMFEKLKAAHKEQEKTNTDHCCAIQ